MKKAYLSIGFSNRSSLQAEIDTLKKVLDRFQIALFIFVDTYHFSPPEEKQMMQRAFADIDDCDLFIAEVSEKAIGVGIELGYATALKKPVIYMRNDLAEHSSTASGSAGYQVIYQNTADLEKKLADVLAIISI